MMGGGMEFSTQAYDLPRREVVCSASQERRVGSVHNRSMMNPMSGAVQETARKLTLEKYSKLPETIGFKDELIEGDRVLSPMPKAAHTIVLDNVETLLKAQFPGLKVVREAGWHFKSEGNVDNVPGPDLMLMSVEDYKKGGASGAYFDCQPLFVVEIVSSSERRSRRLQKVGLYLEAGAGAVVEIDYMKRCAYVYRPDEEATEILRDGIASPFIAQFSDIFLNVH